MTNSSDKPLVLTIIAKHPILTDEQLWSDPAVGQWDGTLAIKAILEKADNRNGLDTLPYRKAIRRAAYVVEIATALAEFGDDPPVIIQIIGHGMPGRLQLGSSWPGPLDPAKGRAVLDSDCDSYGMLKGNIPKNSSILLLGCDVGSSEPSGYIASGKALLFDIEDLGGNIGNNVYAADGSFHPEAFDAHCKYLGSLVTSNGKPANPVAVLQTGPQPDAASQIQRGEPLQETLTLTSVESAPALGFQFGLRGPLPSTQYLNEFVKVEQPKLLAMTELTFSSKQGVQVEAIRGLRVLRVQRDKGTEYYMHRNETAAPDFPSPMLKSDISTATGTLRTSYLDYLETL